MTTGAIRANTHRQDPRIENGRNEETAKPKSTKDGTARPAVDMDRIGREAEKNAARANFGALGRAETPSMQDQVRAAINESKAEGNMMAGLARKAAVAHSALPNLSRAAEITTGSASMAYTAQNLAGSAFESVLGLSTKPLEHAADNAEFSVGLVAGELTDKIATAKGLYRQFETQYAEYVDVNRQYQNALNNQDHQAIASLSSRKENLKASIQRTVAAFTGSMRAIGKADKKFETTTAHAAQDLAASAVSVGWAAAHPHPPQSFAKDVADGLEHIAVETEIVRTARQLLSDDEH